jgi:DNA polymerase III epsilon subunit-like protein
VTRAGGELRAELDRAGLTGSRLRIGDPSRAESRYARRAIREARAVILDTETTGLDRPDVVEIGVVDAATGAVLLSTLVKPTKPVEAGARWVHGIGDDALADAPTLDRVLPDLLEVIGDREVWAYNAEFDFGALVGHARRARIVGGLGPHLGDFGSWWCLMEAERVWSGADRWAALDGGHRAVDDALAARAVAHAIAGLPMSPDDRTRRQDRLSAELDAMR